MSSIPTSLFSELAPEHVELLRGQGTARSCPANTVLIQEGDESDSLYIIEEGECKVVSSEDGRDVLLGFIGEGGYFGELSLLDGAPRSSSVITTKPSRIRTISAVRFREYLAEHPDAALALTQTLARKIRNLTESVRSLAVRDVYGRVVRVLMTLSEDADDGTRQVTRRLTHQNIADMVGASREMVSRILRELTVGGYIDVVKQRIRIHRKLPARW
jgi:CRP/FNR family cyclic AMP-dependent transcriptional regulator